MGALVLWAGDLDAAVRFYRALGVPLEAEQHGPADPVHFASELSGCHFAVFAADAPGRAPGLTRAGCSLVGLAVESVEVTLRAARDAGAPVLQEPEMYPWGLRAVVADPDGRPVELFQRPDTA